MLKSMDYLSHFRKTILNRSSPVAQQVKDLALSLPWFGSLLWRGFSPWCGNFHMPQVWPKKKIKDIKQEIGE